MSGYFPSPLDELYKGLYNPAPRTPSLVSQTPPLGPQEEDSLLSKLVGGGMTGLQWVGNLLDKSFGGRAIRGVLGGHPEELASILPLSDTLGITDIKNRVSGEDLLKQAGIDTGTEWGNTALGIGAEIGLDPATYLSLGAGALTKAGAAAKKAGTLAPSMAGRIAAGQGGLAGFGIPPILSLLGADVTPSVVLGTGKTAERVAKGLGSAAEAALYSRPGAYLSEKFDSRIPKGVLNPFVQKDLRTTHAEELARNLAASRGSVAGLVQDLPPELLKDPEALRSAIEAPAIPGVTHPAVLDYRNLDALKLQQLQNASARISPLADPYAEHAARYATLPERTPSGFVPQDMSGTFASTTKRKEWTKGIPGGTPTIQDILRDPNVAGLNRTLPLDEARLSIMQDYLAPRAGFSFDPSQFREFQQLAKTGPGVVSPDVLDELSNLTPLWKKAGQVAKAVGTYGEPITGPGGIGLYANHPLADMLKYVTSADRAIANANLSMRQLTNPDVLQAGAEAFAAGKPTVPMSRVIKNAGLSLGDTPLPPPPGVVNATGPATAQQQILDKMIQQGRLGPNAKLGDLKNIPLPADFAQSLARAQGTFGAPDEGLRMLDSATLLNKAMMTGPWPAFHGRNLLADVLQSLSKGTSIQGLTEAAQIRKALGAGEVYPGLAAKIPQLGATTDAEAMKALARQQFAFDAGSRGNVGTQLAGITDTAGLAAPSVLGEFKEPSLLDAIKSYWKGRTNQFGESIDPLAERANPLNVGGFGGFLGLDKRNVTQFGPSVAGQQLSHLENAYTRDPTFIERLLAGYSPKAAGDVATAAHFDYGAMTGFERNVIRRLFPFYGWTKNIVPSVIGDLARNPGGLYAQGIRAGADVRNEDQFLPSNLADTTAIPLGDEQGGIRSFLTSLGLPFEDVTRLAPVGPTPVRSGLEDLASMLNPLLRAPLEYATGKSFYSGRELSDRGARTGNLLLDELLSATPASRVASTASMVANPDQIGASKLLNLLTGAKIQDVKVDEARKYAIRDLLAETMAADPQMRKSVDYYVKKEDQVNLTPEQLQILKLAQQLKK